MPQAIPQFATGMLDGHWNTFRRDSKVAPGGRPTIPRQCASKDSYRRASVDSYFSAVAVALRASTSRICDHAELRSRRCGLDLCGVDGETI
eukprot:14005005-Alexandrium_andersonii.AAC.1